MIKNYNQFKKYQESYRKVAINDNALKRVINAMLPMFLLVDSKNSSLDHLLFNECIINYFRESNGMLCPLCDSKLEDYDKDMHSFKCLSCNILFNPFDNKVNSIITSYLYNTMKEKDCQAKNQIFEENISKKDMVENKCLQSNEIEKGEISYPKYLQKAKKSNKESHYLYDSSIVEHLTKAHKGAYICPICDSGLGDNKSGALSYDEKGGFFHCFACGCNLFPIDNTTRETVALQLKGIESNSQSEKDSFQENIESFNKQLQLQDLGLTDDERLDIIKNVFSKRGYSDETLNYVLNERSIFLIADDEITHKKVLYVTMFDTNLQDIIGYEKLYYTEEEERLAKYNQRGSIHGFTLFSNHNNPNCCFIVESITNALAILECGYNALCCYTSKKQPYKAYTFALQNGLNPILFLDRDVIDIDSKYIFINWINNIEPFITTCKLPKNADACDLFALEKPFLCDLLRNAFNTYYKKLCYSDVTLEQAFQSTAKITVIQAQVGNGKTTLACTKYKDSLNPLYSVYTKDATQEVGDRLIEELAIEANVVNSDNPIISDDKHGVVTTHERLSKTTQLEDYAVYREDPIDVAFIDEMHKFLQEQDQTIAQPYYTPKNEEKVKDYIAIENNQSLIKYVKDGLDLQMIAYKQDDSNYAVSPIEMAKKVSTTDARNLQTVYLDREYSLRELGDPKNYDYIVKGTTNIFAKKIDRDLAFWLAEYSINATLKEMLTYNYDEIKDKLKAKYPKLFKSIRNIYLPLALAFFRNCYLVCAFPIRESDNKPLSFDEWKENIGCAMKENNNRSILFKIQLRYVNYLPLVNILKRAKKVFLFGASDFTYKEQLLNELRECFGDDFKYYNIAPCGKKELETSIIKLKKLENKDIAQVMQGVSTLDSNAVLVTPKIDRAKEIYKVLKRHKINEWSFFTKDCFTSFFYDSVDYETIDSKTNAKPFKDIVVYANAPILESSNKLEDYTLMLLDCNIFKPTIEYANPYLEELGITIIEQLKAKLIQIIGRLYRQKGHRIVIVLMNHTSVEFDIVNFLREKSEVVNVYEDSNNYTYYNNPKDFVENIQRALNGEEITKYKVRKHKALTEEQKQEKKEEKQAKNQAKAVELVANGASERDLKRATHDNKNRTAQEWLAINKEVLAKHAPKGICPFTDDVLKSSFVAYDSEVYPNEYIICFHSDKGIGYSVVNPDYDWLCHFKKLPLIGFNNSRYDNLILYYALLLLQPNSTYLNKFEDNFNTSLKAFSNKIIESKDCKSYAHIKYTSQAIGLGDSQEMIVKNLPGKSHDSIKAFMLDYNQNLIEAPYDFDSILNLEQVKEVVKYCANDSLAVYYLIKNNQAIFQAWLKLTELAGLNGNYSKNALISEVIYNKELTKKERCQYNKLTLDCLIKEFPNFEYIPGLDVKNCYVNEFEDYYYILGDGGFNLLETRVFKKNQDGTMTPIENNHAVYENVICLDVSSMHPHSLIAINYFGEYTKNYIAFLEMKDICSSMKKKGFEYVKQELVKHGFSVESEEEIPILRNCFKLILNSTYGLTHMSYESQLKKCVHNLIALRGALFISSLHHALIHKFQGIEIIQIKTDSIKIANYTQDMIDFCNDFASIYGYTFETEDTFTSILCNGNDYLALSSNEEFKNSLTDEEDTEEEEDMKKYEALCKGSSFKLLYDDRGNLRSKNDLRSLLFRFKGKSVHKLGIIKTQGKKKVYDYVKDVQSTKVKYYLAVKETCQDALYPYYINKNGNIGSISGFTSQKVIPIYSLKELASIEKSIIDFDFYQDRVDKVMNKVLDLMIEKKVTIERIKELNKRTYDKRLPIKLSYLNEKELAFYNVLKKKLAFV